MIDYKKFILSNNPRNKQRLLARSGKKVTCDFCRRQIFFSQIIKSNDRHDGKCIYCADIPEFKEFFKFKADLKKTFYL